MTMLLSEAREIKNYFTGKASDVARQLAFAGIAVIWLFKTSDLTKPVPHEYLWPLWFFLLTLLSDLLQYFYGGTAWSIFCTVREPKHGSSGTTEIKDAPKSLNYVTAIFFNLKMIFMTIGYFLLLKSMWTFLRP